MGRKVKLWKVTRTFKGDVPAWNMYNVESWGWEYSDDPRAKAWYNIAYVLSGVVPSFWPLFAYKWVPGPLWIWLIPCVIGLWPLGKSWCEVWLRWVYPYWSVIWSFGKTGRRGGVNA